MDLISFLALCVSTLTLCTVWFVRRPVLELRREFVKDREHFTRYSRNEGPALYVVHVWLVNNGRRKARNVHIATNEGDRNAVWRGRDDKNPINEYIPVIYPEERVLIRSVFCHSMMLLHEGDYPEETKAAVFVRHGRLCRWKHGKRLHRKHKMPFALESIDPRHSRKLPLETKQLIAMLINKGIYRDQQQLDELQQDLAKWNEKIKDWEQLTGESAA